MFGHEGGEGSPKPTMRTVYDKLKNKIQNIYNYSVVVLEVETVYSTKHALYYTYWQTLPTCNSCINTQSLQISPPNFVNPIQRLDYRRWSFPFT